MGSSHRIELSMSYICKCAALSVDSAACHPFIFRSPSFSRITQSTSHQSVVCIRPAIKKTTKKKGLTSGIYNQQLCRRTVEAPWVFFLFTTILSVLSFKCVKFLTLPGKLQMIQGEAVCFLHLHLARLELVCSLPAQN